MSDEMQDETMAPAAPADDAAAPMEAPAAEEQTHTEEPQA